MHPYLFLCSTLKWLKIAMVVQERFIQKIKGNNNAIFLPLFPNGWNSTHMVHESCKLIWSFVE